MTTVRKQERRWRDMVLSHACCQTRSHSAAFADSCRENVSRCVGVNVLCLCAAEGADKPGSHVGPGEKFTYEWQVLEGPSQTDAPCIPYLYYSGTEPTLDTNSGLVGPLLVCKEGALSENGRQVACLSVLLHVVAIWAPLALPVLATRCH